MVLLSATTLVSAQTLTGKWKTIDDENPGRVKSIVEITEQDGKYYGTVVELFRLPDEDQDPHCDKCSDDRKDKPVLGLEIIRGAKKADGKDVWEGGKILDPENGRNYTLRMTPVEGGKKLEVRGYLGPFYRNQQWIRVE